MKQCRYCRKDMRPSLVKRHEKVCLGNPDIMRKVREWFDNNAVEIDGVLFAPYANDYKANRTHDMPSVDSLRSQVGTWDDICQKVAPHLKVQGAHKV